MPDAPTPQPEPIPVDATELIDALASQIARLTVENTALRIQLSKTKSLTV